MTNGNVHQFNDISAEVFGKYQHGFLYAGFEWSDEDESPISYGVPKYGALSAPGTDRVRYIPFFKFWQWMGFLPAGRSDAHAGQ